MLFNWFSHMVQMHHLSLHTPVLTICESRMNKEYIHFNKQVKQHNLHVFWKPIAYVIEHRLRRPNFLHTCISVELNAM